MVGIQPERGTGSLKRELGLFAVFSIATGAMISSGLFVLPGIAFQIAGPAMFLAYAVAGLLNVPTMLAQAELSTAMPKAAGSYVVVERTLGPYWGTLAGLINWTSIALKGAFALIGIGTLVELFLPAWFPQPVKVVAVLSAILFAGINLRSVKAAGWVQALMVFGLLGTLVFYVVTAVPHLQLARYRPLFWGRLGDFLSVSGMVFISYGGLTKVVDVGEEVIKPHRNLPLGMFLSYITVNVLYVLVAFVTVGVLEREHLAGSLRPVLDGALATTGVVGEWIVGVAAFLAYATTANASILSAARTPLAMSHDGLLPSIMGRVHRSRGIPTVSLLVTTTFIIVVIAGLSVADLVKMASTMLMLSLALVNVAVVVIRHSGLPSYRPTFRMPGVPWLPIATLVVYGLLITEMGLIALTGTFGFIALGSVWYALYVQRRIQRKSAALYLIQAAVGREIPRTELEDELVQISLERDEIVMDRFDRLVQSSPILDISERISGRELFARLGQAFAPRLNLEPQEIEKRLLAREREASTIVQTGVAIPHIVVSGTNVYEMVIARCREGAVFSELQEPVHVVFALAGSADERNFHLRALMAIASIVQEEGFLQRWMSAANEGQLRDILLLSKRKRVH